jgi:hypothetical protein
MGYIEKDECKIKLSKKYRKCGTMNDEIGATLPFLLLSKRTPSLKACFPI